MFSVKDIVRDLRKLGLNTGDLVNVKASMRAIGKMESGANTLIDALIEVVGDEGLIVTDSFVSAYEIGSQNYRDNVSNENTPSYAGVLANVMVERSDSFRSHHPVQKFCMIGKKAERLAREHTKDSYAYDILKIIAENGGVNLKIGTDKNVPGVGTTHVAIGIFGVEQYRKELFVQYVDSNGKLDDFKINWAGACKESIYQLNEEYKKVNGTIIASGKVGNAPAKLTSMAQTLKCELELIRKDPISFLKCGSDQCITCQLSWEIDRRSPIIYALLSLVKGDIRNFVRALRVIFYKKMKSTL